LSVYVRFCFFVGGNACYFLHEPCDWNSFLFIWDGHIWGHGPCLTLCGPGDSCTCVFDVCSFTLVSFLDTGNMLISYYLLSLSPVLSSIIQRPWEDPLAEPGERYLAQELRNIGMAAWTPDQWKQVHMHTASNTYAWI